RNFKRLPTSSNTPGANDPQRDRHINIFVPPYHKHNPRIDPSAHIRWTSLNFLHSGLWTLHRDELLFEPIDLFDIFRFNSIYKLHNNRN
ncbi:20919_t:CDS:1, partial [Rhizophagus irregularis]